MIPAMETRLRIDWKECGQGVTSIGSDLRNSTSRTASFVPIKGPFIKHASQGERASERIE